MAARRPFAIAVIAAVFAAAGIFDCAALLHPDGGWPAALGVTAILCAVYLWRGANWARWLALAWIGLHVALVAFMARNLLLVHIVIFAGIGYLLFRRDADNFFYRQPRP